MTKHLYSGEDTKELEEVILTIGKNKESIEEPVFDLDDNIDTKTHIEENNSLQSVSDTSMKLSANNNSLFNDIKNIVTNNTKVEKVIKNNFTSGKGVTSFNIDSSCFRPSKVTLLAGKNFESKYQEQLESMLYNSKEDLETDNLFTVIYLADFIKKNYSPITIKSSNFKRNIPIIVRCMNNFYNKNLTVINGIHTMFNGMSSISNKEKSDVS